MTHLSVAGSALEVPDDLVRLSVGIESVADLIADLAARSTGPDLRRLQGPRGRVSASWEGNDRNQIATLASRWCYHPANISDCGSRLSRASRPRHARPVDSKP